MHLLDYECQIESTDKIPITEREWEGCYCLILLQFQWKKKRKNKKSQNCTPLLRTEVLMVVTAQKYVNIHIIYNIKLDGM